MKRYHDMVELLEAVEGNIESLKKSYEAAKCDEEQKAVLRPLVKSSMEHLRSVLEYSAQDIWDSITLKVKSCISLMGKKSLFSRNKQRGICQDCAKRNQKCSR